MEGDKILRTEKGVNVAPHGVINSALGVSSIAA